MLSTCNNIFLLFFFFSGSGISGRFHVLYKDITSFIKEQEINGDPDKFVHCIWYCVTSTRFEDNGKPCDNCVDITVTYNIGNNTFVNQDKLFYKYEIKELL